MTLHVKLAGPDGDPAAPHGVFPIPNDNYEKVRTLDDLALTGVTLDDFPWAKAWRDKLFAPEGIPEICGELPILLTEFLRSPEAAMLSPTLRRARALHHVFSRKQPRVRPGDLLPGSTTTSFVGPPIYVDTIGYCLWPELKSVAYRPQNSFRIRAELAERLNREIFPFWMDRHLPVPEAARASAYDSRRFPNRDPVKDGESTEPVLIKTAGETPRCQALMERVAFYLSAKTTGVSHTVPDWDRLLRYGLSGLLMTLRNDLENAHCDDEGREFLISVMLAFEGAIAYAGRLAEAAEGAGNAELAAICRKVPAAPADTLHEALVSLWICYHLLLQENTNFGLSLGRLDQLLNPFYLRDYAAQPTHEARQACVKRAVELVCHFFLRCSDHVPLSTAGSELLFAGSGSNQALTIGGTRYENGQVVDAVNDMTYIILKATEILGIRDPNVHARYHAEVHHRDAEGRPLGPEEMEPYLLRLTQVNILTRATPAIHGDLPVVQSMSRYYEAHEGVSREEALADAHDYAAIGCVEQNAAGKHYGNTGSTLFALPAVLELALFGGKHRSQGVGPDDPNLLRGDTAFTTPPLPALKNMEEFVAAFRFQLDAMARMAVQNNNYLGRFTARERPSPFLSGLFTGPTNLPGGSGARFRDLSAGGAKYNSAGVAIIGLADVIDSFCVLDALVFGGRMTVKELLAVLATDFTDVAHDEGHWWTSLFEWLRQLFTGEGEALPVLNRRRLAEIRQLIRAVPRFGAGVDRTPGSPCDNSLALHYTELLTQMIHETFYRYRSHRGGRYLVGYWSMTSHAGFGMLSQATPNGRTAGRPFASGMTPCCGIARSDGKPTMILDQILSVASVDPSRVQNGYTYNLSLTTRGPEQRRADTELFARYMRSFAVSGGVLVQMCVSSLDELRAADAAATAAARPGAGVQAREALGPYKDLMIRVAGYSAYFVTLGPQMRREIIDRASFALADGVEQHTAKGR